MGLLWAYSRLKDLKQSGNGKTFINTFVNVNKVCAKKGKNERELSHSVLLCSILTRTKGPTTPRKTL